MKPQRKIHDPVFGPYQSRRFGRSLGVNPLPGGPRICTFNCVYCECGPEFRLWSRDILDQFPRVDDIRLSLESASRKFSADDLDSLTIAGNGEPTLHPELGKLVHAVIEARNRYWPRARTVILTNGTTSHRKSVRCALEEIDDRIVKLDAGTEAMLETLNRPFGRFPIKELVRRIALMRDIVIQSMFIHGPADNTLPQHVETWAGWIQRISPKCVQVYSIDRMPAAPSVSPVSRDQLERIARYVEKVAGVPASVC